MALYEAVIFAVAKSQSLEVSLHDGGVVLKNPHISVVYSGGVMEKLHPEHVGQHPEVWGRGRGGLAKDYALATSSGTL